MDEPPGVRSELQALLTKWWVKNNNNDRRLSRHRSIMDLCAITFKFALLLRAQVVYPAAKWPQTTGAGGCHNFHGNDFAAPRQADVGRGCLAAAWFLLRSLILKLSLTQQIPFFPPRLSFHLISSDSSPFHFSKQSPPPLTLLHPICHREENIRQTQHERRLSVK